jgi:hypothetical protein
MLARERLWARAALGAVLAVFVAQTLVARRTGGEPYPALMMPAFDGGGLPPSSAVPITSLTFEAVTSDGRVVAVDPQDLLAGVPPATVVAVVDYLFRVGRWDLAAVPPTATSWLPGRAATLVRDRDAGLAHRTGTWLRARLQARYPELRVDRMRVVRVMRRYPPFSGADVSRVVAGTVDLGTP